MSNRRMGGMGGPQRGNRSFSQQPFQGGVNPWQGSSNNMNQGLLSQLASNPQQLALALTSLLQPQQMNNPPSLLSLNTSAFSNQDRDFNRFGNRGRDIRRHEPYNKNRNQSGGWRPMENNRNRNRNQNNRDNRKQPAKDTRKDDKDNKKNEKSPDKKKEKADKPVATIDLSIDEEKDEDGKVSKRDWKDEKNQSEEKKDESGDEEDEKKSDPKNKEGKYTGVPVKYLNCFVCNKEMWDGESMDKHVRGRAHGQMLKSLEESIHITVNILRENMRLAEERKMIEWNRVNRLKKYNKFSDTESHCNMCDLKFLGKIIVHRKTDGHQRLKRYLHPNCTMCKKEFPSRMEWIEHRLTPDHLRHLSESDEAKIGEEDGMEIDHDDGDLDLEPLLEEALQMEEENPILELDDNLEGLQNLMPAYKSTRAVSTKSLKPFTGFMCELCNRSFHNETDAQNHLKTKKHYSAFVGAAKEKYMKRDKGNKKEKKGESKEKDESQNEDTQNDEEEGDQEMYDPEEATNEEESTLDNTQEEAEAEADDGDPSVIKTETKPEAKEEKMEQDSEPDEEEIKPEQEIKEEVKTPNRRGNVKNGAGPKSKKLENAPDQEAEKPKPTTYRIPKMAKKGSAKSKKE